MLKIGCHLSSSKGYLAMGREAVKIGEGHIGLAAMENIINHPLLREMPFYLETPNDLDGYAKEIALLKGLYRQ